MSENDPNVVEEVAAAAGELIESAAKVPGLPFRLLEAMVDAAEDEEDEENDGAEAGPITKARQWLENHRDDQDSFHDTYDG